MKILTYDDYLNSSLEEIHAEITQIYLYNEKETQNLITFMNQFANEIGQYENIILKSNPDFKYLNISEKCKDTLKFYQEKARDFSIKK